MREGARGSGTRKLSQLGGGNARTNNLEKDFVRFAKSFLQMPMTDPWKVCLEFLGGESMDTIQKDVGLLLPHGMFRWLHRRNHKKSIEVFGGDSSRRQYWREQFDAGGEWLEGHPGIDEVRYRPHTVVPLQLYGDDCPVKKGLIGSSALCMSLGSPLSCFAFWGALLLLLLCDAPVHCLRQFGHPLCAGRMEHQCDCDGALPLCGL